MFRQAWSPLSGPALGVQGLKAHMGLSGGQGGLTQIYPCDGGAKEKLILSIRGPPLYYLFIKNCPAFVHFS